jgi:hypothetical protein
MVPTAKRYPCSDSAMNRELSDCEIYRKQALVAWRGRAPAGCVRAHREGDGDGVVVLFGNESDQAEGAAGADLVGNLVRVLGEADETQRD